jgi:hypothetical protein
MDALKLLLNASSQKSVEEIFVLAYKRRNDNNFTDKEKKALAELLSITVEEATKVFRSIGSNFYLTNHNFLKLI